MTQPILPTDAFAPRCPIGPDELPPCPGCQGSLRPWGHWQLQGGQLADCQACGGFHAVVLLPRVRYAMVDATVGVWHTSVHPLPPALQRQATPLIAARDRQPHPPLLALRSDAGDAPVDMIADWCRLALRHHWGWSSADTVGEELRFLLAFRQEDLVIPAATPVPKGSYETENPDSDLAPDAFRLRCGSSLITRLVQEHPEACWRALDTELLERGHDWVPRMDVTRGHNVLARLFLHRTMPADVSPALAAFMDERFPFRQR